MFSFLTVQFYMAGPSAPTCTEVLQHVPLASVTAEQLALSLPGIRGTKQLRAALLQRYGAMFPGLDEVQVVARGCAITRLVLNG